MTKYVSHFSNIFEEKLDCIDMTYMKGSLEII